MPTNAQRRETAKRKLERQLERRAQKEKQQRILTVAGSLLAIAVAAGLIAWFVLGNKDATTTASSPSSSKSSPTTLTRGGDGQLPAFKAPADLGANCQYPTAQPASKKVDAPKYPTNQYPKDDPALQKPVLYPRGSLAMANAGSDTNGSQFFLVYKDSKLPPNYTVFGTIDGTGLATLDKIATAGVAGGGEDGKPATEVKVKSVLLD